MRRSKGVNVIGYLQGELGLGEAGRKLVAAAERADIPTSTVTYTRIGNRQEHLFEERGAGEAPYDTNIICVNADQLLPLHRDLGPRILAGRYAIGVWFWEIAHFPANLHASFDLIDEIWVASDFVRSSISAETDKPVHVVPIPLEPPPIPSLGRTELGLPNDFLFLFMLDYYSINARKNPIGVVEAFKRAFTPDDDVALLIKSVNGSNRRDALQRLQDATEGRSDIHIRDGYISAPEKNALMANCDCYVSLHRSEGLGLTMAEAMSLGKPVIATGYSGNLAFMDDANSYLVRYSPTTIPPGCDPYLPGVEWAEPDLDHAAELMRRVYDRPEESEAIGERARSDLLEQHSLDRTGDFIRERLSAIPERRRRLLEIQEPLDHAAAAARQMPGDSFEESASSGTRLVRRLLRRALWPELAAQRRLDAALVDSLQAVVRELELFLGELGRRRERIDDP
jgi:glycosyltransferase involved in cell wall biosynthesis